MDYKYGFKISRKGYDTAEVDTYVDELIARMTAMQEQNAQLFEKLSEAQDMIRRYSETEKNLRSSIAESKRAAADMLDVARVRSANLVNAAREECNRIVDELDRQIEEKYKTIDVIRNNVMAFKTELFTLYSDHIEMVDNLAETANNFEYDPDFSTLSEAIEAFESAGDIDAAAVPEFPEVPEESFFEGGADEAAAAEPEDISLLYAEEDMSASEDAGELTFGFEEISEESAAVTLDEETSADAASDGAEDDGTVDEILFFEAEEAEDDSYAEVKEEGFVEALDDDDEMFKRSESDEHLFSFLKDFVNGSEE